MVNWGPLCFWAGLIFYLSSIPNLKTSQDPFWDELIRNFFHFLFYFILALLGRRPLNSLPAGKKDILGLALVFFYSLTDEFHQHLVPTRTFQIADLLIDNSGSLLAVLFARFLLPRAPRLIKDWAQKLALL